MDIKSLSGKPTTDRNYMRLFRWITGATTHAQLSINVLADLCNKHSGLLEDIYKVDKHLAKAIYFRQHGWIEKKSQAGHELVFDEPVPDWIKK